MTQANIIVTLNNAGTYNVRTPYCRAAIRAWRQIGFWDKSSASWCVKARHRDAIHQILVTHFVGSVGVGPLGAFTVAPRGVKMPAR